MPKLAIRRGDTLDREIDLADQDLRIGRGEQNDVVLADTTKAVSRFHAELRSENGRYTLLDLNSQNGLWSGGKKHQKITLEPGVPVTIGPYTLTLAGASPHRSMSETMPGGGGTGSRPGDTLPRGTERRPLSPEPPPVRTSRPPKAPPPKGSGTPDAPQPGLIAALARMPKPLIFGGFAVFVILIIALRTLLGPAGSEGSRVTPEPTPMVKTGPTNEELLRQYLTEAQALFSRGDFDGAIREMDRAQAVDPGSIEARELRAKAEDARNKLVSNNPIEPLRPEPLKPEPLKPEPLKPEPQRPEPLRPEPLKPDPPKPAPLKPDPPKRDPRKPDPPTADPHADRYARARAALDAGSFTEAINLIGEIQRVDPNYRDTGALLAKAREGQRGVAQKALEDGTRLENAGDWVGSVQQYERAKALDPSFTGVADESAKRVRARMSAEGAEAYKRARQADAVGRTADAITFYDRAARFLPDQDPNRKIARDRLEVLRAKR